ncbi:MAG: CapA family protein [Prevotella sp.]|nr:CapA family protein [Prevotella sp.]
MKIVIAGDILPTEKNEKIFEGGGNSEYLFGKELLKLFKEADFKVANLEGVFIDNGQPIDKSGPCIKASTKSIEGLLPLGISAFSLANNHSLDFGMKGLLHTVSELDKYGIPCFGYGNNLKEARRPFITTVDGIKIGVYACAEYEFTIATETTGGVNPFDELEIGDDISDLKKQVDYLIVLYHGMKEYYRYPAPYIQKRCRKLIDKGADMVCCQHSHCVGCMEKYHDGTILYGQGDFMFCRAENEYRANGLLVSITLPEKEVCFLPVVRNGNRIHLANDDEKGSILEPFYWRSEEILLPGFIQKQYDSFAEKMLRNYELNSMGIIGHLLRKAHLTRYAHKFISKGNDLFQLNALRCEAHRDVYITGLKKKMI